MQCSSPELLIAYDSKLQKKLSMLGTNVGSDSGVPTKRLDKGGYAVVDCVAWSFYRQGPYVILFLVRRGGDSMGMGRADSAEWRVWCYR